MVKMKTRKCTFRNCPLRTAGLYKIEYSTQNVSIISGSISVPHSSESLDWMLLNSLASHLQLSAVFDSSVSPDSGCEDLECYLNTLTGSVPSTSAPSGSLEEAIQIQSSANSSPSSITLGHSPTVTQQDHSHCISNSISAHMHQISPLVAHLPNSAHHHHHTGCDASHGSGILRGLLSTTPQSSPSSLPHPHHMDIYLCEEAIQIQSSTNSSPSSIALGLSSLPPTVSRQDHTHCISNSISAHMHQISPLVVQSPNSAHHNHHIGCDASHGSGMLRGLLSTTPHPPASLTHTTYTSAS